MKTIKTIFSCLCIGLLALPGLNAQVEEGEDKVIIIKQKKSGEEEDINVEVEVSDDGKIMIMTGKDTIDIAAMVEEALDESEVETLIEETLAEYDIERIIEDAFSENNMKIIIESDGEVIELGADELSEELRMELDDIDSQREMEWVEHHIMEIEEEELDRPVMGVQIENAGGNGVLVTEVFEGSGAEKAGMKPGDLITKIGRKKVYNVENVVDLLSGYEEGDKVKVRFMRNGDTKKKKITLNKWQPKKPKKPHFKMEDVNVHMKPRKQKINKIIVKKDKGSNDVIISNPPAPRPNVDLFQLEMNYSGSREAMTLEFSAAPKPTTVRLIGNNGSVIHEEVIQDFNGTYLKEIPFPQDLKSGGRLEIEQDGKSIVEKLR